MKTKIVLWGNNAEDEKLLLAIELQAEKNKVNIWTFGEQDATEEFVNQLMNSWRNDDPVVFPDNHQFYERPLTQSETILPDHIKTEQTDVVKRAQSEWSYIVLSHKMKVSYESELAEIQENIDELSEFSDAIWERLKGFWSKVQTQVREKNLFHEHQNKIREETNRLFQKLKDLRKQKDEEFAKTSRETLTQFQEKLQKIEEKIEKGLGLQPLFEDLKALQREFRDLKFTRGDRSAAWNRLDRAFKQIKEKRFGSTDGKRRSPLERIQRRYDGLIAAIEKMERSIGRDERDLQYETRKVDASEGQLEEQIRQAKIQMIQERVRSKSDKLREMNETRVQLEQKIEIEKQREAKREEVRERKEAKKDAAQKIKSTIKEAEEARKENAEKLEKAAEKIVDGQQERSQTKKEEGLGSALKTTLGESLTDVVDTIRAVSGVFAEKIRDEVEELLGDEEE